MTDEEYISHYVIGQVIKYTNKYWQITKFDSPQTGDVFIPNSNAVCICTCPPWLYFGVSDKRYIVTEVNVTPVKEEKPKEFNKKLDKGTVIIHENVFYEVIDYRTPQLDEFYAYRFADSSCAVFQRLFPKLMGPNDQFNIVEKIEPYRKGEILKLDKKFYTVVDYACPKKNQILYKENYAAAYPALHDWLEEKAFILEPIAPEPIDDPEATAYQPGQLIVRENVVYRVIEYRKARKDEYMTLSTAIWVFPCVFASSSAPRWIVEPYCVS